MLIDYISNEHGQFLTPEPYVPGATYHYWMGDGRDGKRLETHILCMMQTEVAGFDGVHVTTMKQDVTCQECLELIHS